MYDPKAFGKFLLEKRKAKKITLAQLGQRTGVDAGFLSRMERGESKSPSADTLAKIADGLGIKRELVFYVAGVLDSNRIDYEELLKPIDFKEILTDESKETNWEGKPLSKKDRETIKEIIEVVLKRESH